MIFKTLISKGGAVMWPLLALALISIVIIADRLAVLLILQFSKAERKLNGAKYLKVLDLIAQIAPVLGFLGTVTGIMAAFQGMSLADNIGLQSVSGGMYEALFTTAVGLVISIVDSVCAELFRWWVEALCKKAL